MGSVFTVRPGFLVFLQKEIQIRGIVNRFFSQAKIWQNDAGLGGRCRIKSLLALLCLTAMLAPVRHGCPNL
jgi:hypothetical protein